jgi:hypothetical protein
MSTGIRLLAVLGVVLMLAGAAIAPAMAAQEAERILDVADVPLPVDDLPEDGYQVMAGGYLDLESTARWIAESRGRSTVAILDELAAAGWSQSYVLDLVLLEDRAFANSDILALVQTNVYLLADSSGAETVYEVMADYSRVDTDDEEPAILESTTVRLVSQSGDTLRTLFVRDRAVIEVVSLERFGFADPELHRNVVAHTADRAEYLLQDPSTGLAPRAVRLVDGETLADFQEVQQSGVHHVYRIRDGKVQPAAGEVERLAPDDIAIGVEQVYYASEGLRLGGGTGTGFMSTWIGEFNDVASATTFVDEIFAGEVSLRLEDPFFAIGTGEQAMPQGVEGLYRVTGVFDGQAYSGNLEVRQQGPHVVAVGFRTSGSALPPVDVTSRVMDHQLLCLELDDPCPPMNVADLLAAPSATPVAPSGMTTGDAILSQEFGWSLQQPVAWSVTEQFTEPGYDFVELQSGRSLVTIESVINQHGDVQQCVLDELDALRDFESSAVIGLGSDVEGEHPAGMADGHAWAIYTVEPLADERADQEYTIRFDCYTLIDGGASLVITHRAPRYEWDSERELGQEIRDAIVMPSSSLVGEVIARIPANDVLLAA